MAGRAQSPQERAPVEPQRRDEGDRHQAPGQQPEPAGRAAGEQRQQRRREVGECHPDDGAGEQERRVAQLRIGRSRHHPADVLEVRIGAGAEHALGEAEPDRALRLEQLRQRAVVDQRVADRVDAARGLERVAAHQHAAAGGGRGRARGLVRPRERIEHLEEEDERRNEAALGKAVAAQLHHQRGEHELAGHCARRQSGKNVGRSRRCRHRTGGCSRADGLADCAAATPCFTAHSLPVQPRGSGCPAMISQALGRVQPRRRTGARRRRCRRCCRRRPG